MAKAEKKSKNVRTAIYPGSFDPITNGHLDIIHRSLSVFDNIIVLIANSSRKKPLFSAEERKEMIEESFVDESRVKADIHSGLFVDYARKRNIRFVVRGLRAVSDFDYEFQIATINRKMYPELQEFFLVSTEKYFFVNSSVVKEVIGLGGDLPDLIPSHVDKRIREKLC